MGCVVIYPNPLKNARTPWRLISGQLDGRACAWTVTLWYDVPEESCKVDGKFVEARTRRITLQSKKPVWLEDLIREIITPHLDEEAKLYGKLTNIRWQASQGR